MKLFFAALVLALPVGLSGQSFIPRTIRFEGAPQYQQTDLLAASGLAPGKSVTQADLDAATQRLGDLGIFSDITFATSGTALTFNMVPISGKQMRPVVLTNFVLCSREELLAAVKKQVPLFTGEVPIAGGMQEMVERALEEFLKQHGIQATVAFIRGPAGLDYSIATPPVRIASVNVQGADFDGDAALKAIRARFVGVDYVEQTSGDALRKNLMDAFADEGFADASVTPIVHGPAQVAADAITVALTGAATPGLLYRVAKLTLPPPAPGVATDDIAKAVQLKVNEPASRILLLSTQARLTNAFERHGYLDAATTVTPVKDASAHTFSYAFMETPGEVYHLRALLTKGMSPQQAGAAASAWKLAPGAVYEGSTVALFMRDAGGKLCNGRPVTVSRVAERATHQVDVLLSCAQAPAD